MRRVLVPGLIVAGLSCHTWPGPQSPAPESAAEIEKISLVLGTPRRGCPGHGYMLSRSGVAFDGVRDGRGYRRYGATIDAVQFEALAELVFQAGFFAWPTGERRLKVCDPGLKVVGAWLRDDYHHIKWVVQDSTRDESEQLARLIVAIEDLVIKMNWQLE